MPTSISLPPVFVLARLGPAFGKGQCAGAEWASFALARPGLPDSLSAVHGKPCTQRRNKQRAHTVGSRRFCVRLRVDQQRLADVVPGQGDLLVPGADALGPEVARIAGLGELSLDHRN